MYHFINIGVLYETSKSVRVHLSHPGGQKKFTCIRWTGITTRRRLAVHPKGFFSSHTETFSHVAWNWRSLWDLWRDVSELPILIQRSHFNFVYGNQRGTEHVRWLIGPQRTSVPLNYTRHEFTYVTAYLRCTRGLKEYIHKGADQSPIIPGWQTRGNPPCERPIFPLFLSAGHFFFFVPPPRSSVVERTLEIRMRSHVRMQVQYVMALSDHTAPLFKKTQTYNHLTQLQYTLTASLQFTSLCRLLHICVVCCIWLHSVVAVGFSTCRFVFR